uniref:Uncharacterized protein n=1 Tax=Eptatretus burgeri TaxID=7764 RepID=A0A8C4WXZ8_EPTBU
MFTSDPTQMVTNLIALQNIPTLPEPAFSPDLSLIEHVWDEMERRLRSLKNQLATLAQLRQALVQIWN